VAKWAEKGKVTAKEPIRKKFQELEEIFSDYHTVSQESRKEKINAGLALLSSLEDEAQPKWQENPLQCLKGVGPKGAKTLSRIGLETIEDIIYYFPRCYEDRSRIVPISELRYGEIATIKGKVLASSIIRPRKKMEILTVKIGDGSGIIGAVWFNQAYLEKVFPPGTNVILTGKVGRFGRFQVGSASYEVLGSEEKDIVHTGRIVPVYALTSGLTQRWLRSFLKRVVVEYAPELPDALPSQIRKKHGLSSLSEAIAGIHFPSSEEEKDKARERLIFEEFLLICLALKKRKKKTERGISHRSPGKLFEEVRRLLPFKLTKAQRKAIAEIKEDMSSVTPMQRLLEGDVGSGKTIVAISALLCAVESGSQGVLMAPTEILAEQHFLTIGRLLASIGVKAALLIGSMSPEMKGETKREIEAGEINIIIGTHTLIQERVRFSHLGLVVIDEQQRFGVEQRKILREKGVNPDLLLMSATPIPRTLALTLYGDMDISIITELPAGRRPVATHWVKEKSREDVYKFVSEEVRQGRQAYIVCPLIEESPALGVKSAMELAKHLQREIFPELKVGLLHGRMKGKEKEAIMKSFKEREKDILVSTTVIEVGIDIPNASVMVIENADRFGLAQLHQMRGRVGRGNYQSYCIMIAEPNTEEGERRLKIMTETTDGFRIAEEDLTLRGPGELFGSHQSGMPELRIGDIASDMKLMELARREAGLILATDPELQGGEYYLLRQTLNRRFPTPVASGD
jgi:ATP-dependent DNA helicase RecG